MQTVEQLPLIFVDPLHLDIKDGVRVHLHLDVLLQEGGELQLALLYGDRDGSEGGTD